MADEAYEPEYARMPLVRRIPERLVELALRAFWGLRVVGLEHIPRIGPFIVGANHTANVDGPILFVAVGMARTRFLKGLGKAELYRVPLLGAFLRAGGTYPLERGRGDVGALRWGLEVLQGGGCLAIMPEGTRVRTGFPGKPKPGVGFLAAMSGAPFVPARLINADRFPFCRPLEVRFGPPLRFSGDPEDRGRYQTFAQEALDGIFSL